MYPRLRIDTAKYRHNVQTLQKLCHKHGLSMMAVTKVFCADQRLVDIINELEVDYIADSRIMNLRRMKTDRKKVLLRIPSLHEVDEVVLFADVSLNSEMKTIKALNKSAKYQDTVHDIILMVDIGDLREGVYYKESVMSMITDIQALRHINLKGIGTNLTCYGGVVPNQDTLKKLTDIVRLAKDTLGVTFDIISGGNSSHLHLLYKNASIDAVNNLRIGEALILGRETAFGKPLDDLYQDVVTLEADLIEMKQKPSIPEGDIGMDAFGKTPVFEDFGLMQRGILALGKQDVDFHELIPEDTNVRLIGSSSDHIIADLSNTSTPYKLGDVLRFRLSYGSLLSLMTSRYVEKSYV